MAKGKSTAAKTTKAPETTTVKTPESDPTKTKPVEALKTTDGTITPPTENNSTQATEATPTTKVVDGIPQMEQKAILTPENDLAVKAAGGEDLTRKVEMKDDKKSKESIKESKELQKDVEEGEKIVPASSAPNDLSLASQPQVPHPVTGHPVYTTSESYRVSEAAKGNLSTPPPTAEQIKAAQGNVDQTPSKPE